MFLLAEGRNQSLEQYKGDESGLYYLQSRYYDPTWGRFVNADTYVSTGLGVLGHNMFAYCSNNPISYVDPSGYLPELDGITNPNAMSYESGEPYWGPCPWDEDGHLIDTPVIRAKAWYAKMEALGYVHLGKGAKDIISGINKIKDGAKMLLVPCPTIAEDLVGVAMATYGILLASGGIAKTIIGFMRLDDNE